MDYYANMGNCKLFLHLLKMSNSNCHHTLFLLLLDQNVSFVGYELYARSSRFEKKNIIL
jgi:hypothetical protein